MMKWWGWGDPNISFPMEHKPNLWPWVEKKLEVTTKEKSFPIKKELIKLNTPVMNETFALGLTKFLKPEQFTSQFDERLLHTYGKSYPDLYRVRRGQIKRAPDLVVLPRTHEEVERIINLAHELNVCVIPFGGGTNIVGGVEPLDFSSRMVVSLDLREMNKVLSLDPYSMTATIQGGALGPKLEADLFKQGFSLGHYPDSFEYSTLGGWLATRSAGMQSDAYGKIEDMLVSLKMVTPSGTIVTRTVPSSSAGPNINSIAVGSEGILGVITEATMRIHRAPAKKDYYGYLFKSFEDGISAIHECLERGFSPSMVRLQDSGETELAFQMKAPKKGLEGLIQKPVKWYLKKAGYTAPCILVVGFEGDADFIAPTKKAALGILKKHKGFGLGASVGKTWSADKFNIPYLRDYIMDYGCFADVAETSATWSNILPLYKNFISAVKSKFKDDQNGAGYVGCHISHTYKTGACLYFTYSAKQDEARGLEQYYSYKRFVTDTFMNSGGTVSHHHAVGYEHRPWMEQEVSRIGLQALTAIKKSLDPKGILNPGKLLPEIEDQAYLDEASREAKKAWGASGLPEKKIQANHRPRAGRADAELI
jgi:alkyldihydroxyacetonephosphate synthase